MFQTAIGLKKYDYTFFITTLTFSLTLFWLLTAMCLLSPQGEFDTRKTWLMLGGPSGDWNPFSTSFFLLVFLVQFRTYLKDPLNYKIYQQIKHRNTENPNKVNLWLKRNYFIVYIHLRSGHLSLERSHLCQSIGLFYPQIRSASFNVLHFTIHTPVLQDLVATSPTKL